jgi:hypothetical protein
MEREVVKQLWQPPEQKHKVIVLSLIRHGRMNLSMNQLKLQRHKVWMRPRPTTMTRMKVQQLYTYTIILPSSPTIVSYS